MIMRHSHFERVLLPIPFLTVADSAGGLYIWEKKWVGKMETRGNIEYTAKLTPEGVSDGFRAGLLDERKCRAWVFGELHPAGIMCPACGQPVEGEKLDRIYNGDRIACECGKRFNGLTETELSGTQLSMCEIVLLLWFIGQGLCPVRIAEILDVDPTTVRAWKRRFKG